MLPLILQSNVSEIKNQKSTMDKTAWYNLQNLDTLDTPALVWYPSRIAQNIDTLVTMLPEVNRLRPHVKTHKCQEVTELMLAKGITKFKCATIAEAEMLAICQAPDVLLAYQPVATKLQRFITLIQTYTTTQFSCLVDDLSVGQAIATAAIQHEITINVYIDLNVGMNRTGILPQKAEGLINALLDLKGIAVKGLHAYDGHIRDQDLALRTENCHQAFVPVFALASGFSEKGITLQVVAGGSPTFPIHAQNPQVECSPGTFPLWDKGYKDAFPEQAFEPAALVLSRVISHPSTNRICIDLGHKSVAAENDLNRRVHFLNAPDAQFIGQSEEHLVLEVSDIQDFPIGKVLYGVPIHVCPTVALYERAYLAENQSITDRYWKVIARDRKINV